MNRPQPINGEVISFARGYALIATAHFLLGLLCLVGGPWVVACKFSMTTGDRSDWLFSMVAGLVGTVQGLFFVWCCWHLLTHKARLVLADDRMQWVEGKCVVWEASYENIVQLALFSGPRGIGIRLRVPKGSNQAWPQLWWRWERRWGRYWKRYGFNLALPAFYSSEPAERVLEAILTCLHRYRRMKESAGEELDS